MDHIRAMRVFVAVSTAESLSGAGRRLGMPLSTISRHLAALEEHVGATLVARTTRSLALTEAGRDYLETCRRVLDDVDAARHRFAGRQAEPSGELSITAPIVFGRLHVLPVVTAFLRKYKQVSARMLLIDRPVNLVEEGLDVAVRIGAFDDPTLIATCVGSVRLITCASPDYLRRRGRPRSVDDLAAHDFVSFGALPDPHTWQLAPTRNKRRTRPPARTRMVVNTAEAAVDAATAGLGITRVLSYQAAAAIKAGALQEILAGADDIEMPVHLLHRNDRLRQAKVDVFTTFAAQRLRKVLAAKTDKTSP